LKGYQKNITLIKTGRLYINALISYSVCRTTQLWSFSKRHDPTPARCWRC